MPMTRDYLHNAFKHGIEAGILQYGVGQETTSPDVAEVLATLGYDWLFVDGEHGPHTVQTILAIARAIAPYDMTPVVRIRQAGRRKPFQFWEGQEKAPPLRAGRRIALADDAYSHSIVAGGLPETS